jgi:hypothetical protein
LDQLGDGWNGSKLPALDYAATKNRSDEEEQGFHSRKVGGKLGYNKWFDITREPLFSGQDRSNARTEFKRESAARLTG